MDHADRERPTLGEAVRAGAGGGWTYGAFYGAFAAVAISKRNYLLDSASDLVVTSLYLIAYCSVVGIAWGIASGFLFGALSRSAGVLAGRDRIAAAVIASCTPLLLVASFIERSSVPGVLRMKLIGLGLPTVLIAALVLGLASYWPIRYVVGFLFRRSAPVRTGLIAAGLAVLVFAWPAQVIAKRVVGGPADAGAVDLEALPPPARPVAMICLDSANWSFARPLMERGEMPVLERLVREGAHGDLQTSVPTYSPILWATVTTGRAPKDHGVNGMQVWHLPAMKRGISRFTMVPWLEQTVTTLGFPPVNSSGIHRRVPAVWNIVSGAGGTVGQIGLMGTWPAEAVNGYAISDRFLYLEPDEEDPSACYPPQLAEELAKAGLDPRSLPEGWVREYLDMTRLGDDVKAAVASAAAAGDLRESAELDPFPVLTERNRSILYRSINFYRRDRLKLAIAHELLGRQKPDFFLLYIRLSDIVGHLYYRDRDPSPFGEVPPDEVAAFEPVIDNVYRWADAEIGKVLESLGDDYTVVVVSDHGMVAGPEEQGLNSGQHRLGPPGIVVMRGDGIRPGTTIENAHIADVTPTVLTLMGYPVARDMSGRALAEAIAAGGGAEPELVASYGLRDPGEIATVGDRVDDDMRETLEALGYIN